jgi:hypothetical protein
MMKKGCFVEDRGPDETAIKSDECPGYNGVKEKKAEGRRVCGR